MSYVSSLTFSLIPWQTLFLVEFVISRKEWRQKRGIQWWGLTQGSTAEAATAKEWKSRTRVLLTVVALCFISSSQAMQAKFSGTPLMWSFLYPALLCVLLESLGYKEADENKGTQDWKGLKGPISFWFLQLPPDSGKGELNGNRFLHFLRLKSEPSVTQESF